MATKQKKKYAKPKSLSHGRPPTVKPQASLSSKATRTLIRRHHTLEKRRAKALADGDDALAASIAHEIEAQGGIKSYQKASLTGQGNDRGGDSSQVLMTWLNDVRASLNGRAACTGALRLLEVGALSTTNACSRSGLFEVTRIDLNSQAEGILQQDFMERPLPSGLGEKFDMISLSLVLNYVPDAVARGEMLKRTLKFLRNVADPALAEFFPSLFLVLPAPCVENSRYMDETKMGAIMNSLGYTQVKRKLTNKLVYYLWKANDLAGLRKSKLAFKKEEVRSGASRNNFAVVLK
jgi:25S rRNA (adenine2142-N1)-methyltransferase